MRDAVVNMPPFYAMEVFERAQELERQGRSIAHLEVGEPDFPTPQCVVEAAKKAIDEGKTHYTASVGIPELRQAICDAFLERYNVSISPDQIIVTNGSSPALLLIFSALLEEGDEVIMSDPHYPCYTNVVEFLDGKPVFVNLHEEDGFEYNPLDIQKKISPKTKAILINSPANPTGHVIGAKAMSEIASLGPTVVSDEVYSGLAYNGKEHSILEFTDNAFVADGFSKRYSMTGWRLGYLIAPKSYVQPVRKLMQNLFIAANTVSQWAGVAALKEAGPDVKYMVNLFNQRRKIMLKGVRKIGLGVPVEPNGAFYVLANAKKFSVNSLNFAFELLEEASVGVTPGIDFGRNTEGYIRFSYANSIENIYNGIKRLEGYLKNRQYPQSR